MTPKIAKAVAILDGSPALLDIFNEHQIDLSNWQQASRLLHLAGEGISCIELARILKIEQKYTWQIKRSLIKKHNGTPLYSYINKMYGYEA